MKHLLHPMPDIAPLQVAVIGGGSFATAMGAALARRNPQIDVHMLMRGEQRCQDFNDLHENQKYLPGLPLPHNMRAGTDVHNVLEGAQYVVHALPVQATRPFLVSIKDTLPPNVPIICVSKGIEQTTGFLLSEVFPSALERPQPCVFMSGPSFAKEVRHAPPPCPRSMPRHMFVLLCYTASPPCPPLHSSRWPPVQPAACLTSRARSSHSLCATAPAALRTHQQRTHRVASAAHNHPALEAPHTVTLPIDPPLNQARRGGEGGAHSVCGGAAVWLHVHSLRRRV